LIIIIIVIALCYNVVAFGVALVFFGHTFFKNGHLRGLATLVSPGKELG